MNELTKERQNVLVQEHADREQRFISPTLLDHLQQRLAQERACLAQWLSKFESSTDLNIEAHVNRRRQLLQAIEHAQQLCGQGLYGICEVCGKRIAIERLLAAPYAVSCCECMHSDRRIPQTLPRGSLPSR